MTGLRYDDTWRTTTDATTGVCCGLRTRLAVRLEVTSTGRSTSKHEIRTKTLNRCNEDWFVFYQSLRCVNVPELEAGHRTSRAARPDAVRMTRVYHRDSLITY